MHPLHIEQTARIITEERLRTAAAARRVRALAPVRTSLRDRVGVLLVRGGQRLQGHRPATVQPGPC